MFVFPDRNPPVVDPAASLASLMTMAPQMSQTALVQTLAELFSTWSQASTSNKTWWQLCHHRLPFPRLPPHPSSQASHIQEQLSRLQLLTTCFWSSCHLWSLQCLLYSAIASFYIASYLWREETPNSGGTSARRTSSCCRTLPSRPLLLLTSMTAWSRLWVTMTTTPLLLPSSLAPAPPSGLTWPSLTAKMFFISL